MCFINCNYLILECSKSKSANNDLDSAFNITYFFQISDLAECTIIVKDNNLLPTTIFLNFDVFELEEMAISSATKMTLNLIILLENYLLISFLMECS